MKALHWINFVLLFLLGLSTGLVKVFGMEADMKIFAALGFPEFAARLVGLVQAVAALMLLAPVARAAGALVLALSFVVATAAVFASGMVPFGIFSLLFIAMAAWTFSRARKSRFIAA
jgi:hypothetical protein